MTIETKAPDLRMKRAMAARGSELVYRDKLDRLRDLTVRWRREAEHVADPDDPWEARENAIMKRVCDLLDAELAQ